MVLEITLITLTLCDEPLTHASKENSKVIQKKITCLKIKMMRIFQDVFPYV